MSLRTRVKFCGITRTPDAACAVGLGVDALGFVFTRRSRRFVEPAAAAAIRATLPPFVCAVALFMDDEPAWIAAVLDVFQADLIQFHGTEPAALCDGFARPYLKAIAMASVADVPAYLDAYPRASGFVLDAHAAGEAGGTGQRFDWMRARGLARPVVLAGGLTTGTVGEAIARTHPYAVDVSSGIETTPGIKDDAKMRAFAAAVRAADCR
jgi:phosphoribosylanthranilate isomerase